MTRNGLSRHAAAWRGHEKASAGTKRGMYAFHRDFPSWFASWIVLFASSCSKRSASKMAVKTSLIHSK